MKDDALLARLVEVQSMPRGQVEQIVVRERAIQIRTQMIGRDETFRLAAWRNEYAAVRVVGAVRQKLQRQKRMRRPAFS